MWVGSYQVSEAERRRGPPVRRSDAEEPMRGGARTKVVGLFRLLFNDVDFIPVVKEVVWVRSTGQPLRGLKAEGL